MSRTYDQYCPVASGLDILGDRWTMLILRDLVWYGPARFGDLITHNVGIPTALLSDRLRTLINAGVVARDGRWYRVMDPHEDLRSMIDSVASVGARFLASEPPSKQSLDYLARRRTTTHNEALAGLPPRSMTITIGSLTVGCTIGGGRIEFGEPHSVGPHVCVSTQAFMQLVAGQLPERLPIGGPGEDSGTLDLLRFLGSAA